MAEACGYYRSDGTLPSEYQRRLEKIQHGDACGGGLGDLKDKRLGPQKSVENCIRVRLTRAKEEENS